MNEIISYFSSIPSSHRSLILVAGITIFWLIENAFPLFKFNYKKWHHAGINIFFSVNEFNLLKEEILELIKIAKKTMQTKYKVVFVSTRTNYKNVVPKERKIVAFTINKEFYRKKEENINDSIFRYFLKIIYCEY